MGKKSLIKSTSKKKNTATAESEEKKIKASGKATTQKAAAKSAKPKVTRKTTAKASAAKPKSKTAKTKGKSAGKAKKVSLKTLVLKQFESPVMAAAPPPAAAPAGTYTAPPFTEDPETAKVLKMLLSKQFDLYAVDDTKPPETAVMPKQPEPEPPAETPAEPVAEQPEPESPAETPAEPVAEQPEPESPAETPAEPVAEQPEPEAPAETPAESVAAEPEGPALTAPAAMGTSIAQSTYTAPGPGDGVECEPRAATPLESFTKILAIGGLVFVLALLLITSLTNRNNYYIEQTRYGLEIQKGNLAPMGKAHFMLLPRASGPETIKPVYSREEVFAIICQFHQERADELLMASDTPDFDAIKKRLRQALGYAITPELKASVQKRLNTIELLTLVYKADVAVAKSTDKGLEQALSFLEKAGRLDLDADQAALVANKTAAIEAMRKSAEQPE